MMAFIRHLDGRAFQNAVLLDSEDRWVSSFGETDWTLQLKDGLGEGLKDPAYFLEPYAFSSFDPLAGTQLV